MDKRKYMTIIADFFDWCYLNHIEMDDMNDDVMNKYVTLKSNDSDVKEALAEFKSFL